MGKGEIACYEQFLLFPQCFQKACFPGASKGVIVWEWVNPQAPKPSAKQSRLLTPLYKKPFKNIVGKGENGGHQHFLLFLQCFLLCRKDISIFHLHLFCCLQLLLFGISTEFCCLVKS